MGNHLIFIILRPYYRHFAGRANSKTRTRKIFPLHKNRTSCCKSKLLHQNTNSSRLVDIFIVDPTLRHNCCPSVCPACPAAGSCLVVGPQGVFLSLTTVASPFHTTVSAPDLGRDPGDPSFDCYCFNQIFSTALALSLHRSSQTFRVEKCDRKDGKTED